MLTFGGHLEVFRRMLFRIIAVAGAIAMTVFCFKETTWEVLLAPSEWDFFSFRWMESALQVIGIDFRFEEYHVNLIATDLSSQFMTHITTAVYLGLLGASPYILYELFRFISPALYENERKYSVQVAGIIYVQFLLGVLMSYFVLKAIPQLSQALMADGLFVASLGNIASRRRCAGMIESRGGVFIPIIHRSASLGPNVTVGDGSFVAHNVVLTADVKVGRHACVFHGTVIGHDTTLGDYSHVYSLVSIGGGVRVGEGASVFPGAKVVPRVSIGDHATVGIGSTVIRDVDPDITVFGSPAERFRLV